MIIGLSTLATALVVTLANLASKTRSRAAPTRTALRNYGDVGEGGDDKVHRFTPPIYLVEGGAVGSQAAVWDLGID